VDLNHLATRCIPAGIRPVQSAGDKDRQDGDCATPLRRAGEWFEHPTSRLSTGALPV